LAQITTDRLVLRPISVDDVDALVSLDRDPEVMRYLTGGKPSSRDDVEATIRQELGHRWMAHRRDTGDFVGWFGMRAQADGEYELGYRLRRATWGHGLATEGARALIDVAFSQLGARRVWAETMAVNVRSRRVLERCGLQLVRTFHLEWDDPIEGTEMGEVEYELRREDWVSPASLEPS
jgi:RimJ/RimL family protein N-acetyltransferase